MALTRLPAFLGPPTQLAIQPSVGLGLAATRAAVPNFAMRKQLQSNWCWAAVTEAVLALAGAPKTQDLVATEHMQANGRPGVTCAGPAAGNRNNQSCGATPACAADCNDTHFIRHVLTEQGRFRAIITAGGIAPTYAQIQTEIARQRPMIVVINWPPVGPVVLGHFIAVTGWQVANGVDYVEVHDPANPASGSAIGVSVIPYSSLTNNYRVSGPGGRSVFSYSVQ